jgi:tetratricopeptide (TPR) repeat protein/outer membrane protein OmpA-like peptidoglycan-associated protein
MRHFRQIFYSVTVITAAVLSGCSVKTNMLNNNYTVTPNPLEVKGDSIAITISANVPAKSINPKANIQFQPYLSTPKGEVALKTMTIGGEKATGTDITINSKTGGKINYTEKIAYNPDLKRVTLYPDFAVKVGTTTEYKAVPNVKGSKVLAEGTITTPLLVKSGAGNMVFDADNYAASPESKMVNIYFPKDIAKFNAGFKIKGLFDNKKQIEELRGLMKADKNWVVKGISINAYASPDGELTRNEGLSKGRSESTFNYFKKELKKLGFTEVNDQNLKLGYTLAEDWAGYEKAVAASTHPDKDGVLNIIKNKSVTDEEREGLIKRNYPKFWEATKNTLLPALRRSELVVNGQKPLKTDDELKASIGAGTLDSLNETELLHLGAITTDLGQKAQIYTAMTNKYPQDWRGFNDLGAVQVSMGNTAEGMANLEKASTLSPENPTILVNIGNSYLMNNNYAKAEESFKAAAAKGGDVSYGMGILAVKNGNYADAVSNFNKSNKKDFNLALAQLLNGQADAAKATIDNMKPEEMTWECYYLRAIIGARTSNQDLMTTNLTRAIQINANVRNMAKDDVEFIKFWGNPAFQGAIR